MTEKTKPTVEGWAVHMKLHNRRITIFRYDDGWQIKTKRLCDKNENLPHSGTITASRFGRELLEHKISLTNEAMDCIVSAVCSLRNHEDA